MNTIHNVRITLVSTALNSLGVGAILAGLVAPLVNGTVGGLVHVKPWVK